MSIFGRNNTGSTLTAPVYEGYSHEYNGDLLAIQEGFEDQLAIIESIHALDMEEIEMKKDVRALEESGADADAISSRIEKFEAVAEGMAGDVWSRIKNFFTKMWGKLKAFFASIVRFFDGLFKSGKDFVTKYEKELIKLNLNGYKAKMYKYSHLDEEPKAKAALFTARNYLVNKSVSPMRAVSPGKSGKDMQDEIDAIEQGKEDILNGLRGEFVGGGNLDKSEYSKELFGYFRSGAKSETDKDEVSISIKDIISTLKDDKVVKAAEAAVTDCNKVFEDQIKEIDKVEAAIGKAATDDKGKETSTEKYGSTPYKPGTAKNISGEAISYVQKCSSMFSEAKNIALDFFRAWKEAITERNSEYKSVAVKAFRYKKKED